MDAKALPRTSAGGTGGEEDEPTGQFQEMVSILRSIRDTQEKQSELLESLLGMHAATSATLTKSSTFASHRSLATETTRTAADEDPPIETSFYLDPRCSVNSRALVAPNIPHSLICQLDPRPSVSDWQYWRPLDPDARQVGKGSVQYWHMPGRGRPDYVPEWELDKRGGDWFHVDDVRRRTPCRKPQPRPDRVFYQRVPYAQTASPIFELHGSLSYYSRDGPHLVSVASWKNLIKESLGELYAVPSDSRVALGFSRSVLRTAGHREQLDGHLSRLGSFFAGLKAGGGDFCVVDYDDFMNHAFYRSDTHGRRLADKMDSETDDLAEGFLSAPAIANEINFVNIPPTVMDMSTPDDSRCIPRLRKVHWHRLIYIQGMEALDPDWDSADVKAGHFRQGDAYELLFRSGLVIGGFAPHDTVAEAIYEAVNLYETCGRRLGSHNPYTDLRAAFHISWFRVSKRADKQNERWKCYDIWDAQTCAVQCAFTLGLFPGRDPMLSNTPGSDDVYLTALLLSPIYMKSTYNEARSRSLDRLISEFRSKGGYHYSILGNSSLQGMSSFVGLCLECIAIALRAAADSWDEIGTVMQQLIFRGEAILSPEELDKLLLDDDAFSESRRSLWIVNTLDTFQRSIGDTIHQWEMWWEAWEVTVLVAEQSQYATMEARQQETVEGIRLEKGPKRNFEHAPKENRPRTRRSLDMIEAEIRRLKSLRDEYRANLTLTQTLRQDLFSASSVIESRQATDLGKTVKLLTYVSIFYLPLGVCASWFSINAEFGLVTFAIVTVAVALSTYLAVVNLDNVVTSLRAAYGVFKQPLVDEMGSDPSDTWRARGVRFTGKKPQRVSLAPSEWFVIGHVGVRIGRALGIIREADATRQTAREVTAPSLGEAV